MSQFPFPGRQITKGCVDAAYVDAKLVIEVDGRSWHTRIADVKRDHERDADAARSGWQTLRLLWEHVVGDPEGSAAVVRDVLRERRLQLASYSRGNAPGSAGAISSRMESPSWADDEAAHEAVAGDHDGVYGAGLGVEATVAVDL